MAEHQQPMEQHASYDIVLCNEPGEEVLEAIVASLLEFNLQNGPAPNFATLALALTGPDAKAIGGLWARLAYDWLFVEYLAVPCDLRGNGYGRALMKRIEEIALERGCVGIWLDTFAFQALPFYEKLGFTVFGKIEDQPPGSARYFLQKRLR